MSRSGATPLDRRTFPFAVVAVGVWLLWAYLLPTINHSAAWNDPVRPGDVLQLTRDATVVPPTGWGIRSGIRTTDHTLSGAAPPNIVLAADGVLVTFTVGPWAGTAPDLLGQVTAITTTTSGGNGFHVTSGADTFTTRDGAIGVLETFSSPRTEGLIAAVVLGDQGVQIQAAAPPDQVASRADDIQTMITSITRTGL